MLKVQVPKHGPPADPSRSGSNMSKNVASDRDVQEVLAWAERHRAGETFPLILIVRKGQPHRPPSKELYYLILAVRSEANSAKLLLLKKDGSNFVVSTKRSMDLSDVVGIDVNVESSGGYGFLVHSDGNKPAFWVARTSSDRLHFAVTAASTFQNLYGNELPVTGVDEKELNLWSPAQPTATSNASDAVEAESGDAADRKGGAGSAEAEADAHFFALLEEAHGPLGGEDDIGVAMRREKLEEELSLLQVRGSRSKELFSCIMLVWNASDSFLFRDF